MVVGIECPSGHECNSYLRVEQTDKRKTRAVFLTSRLRKNVMQPHQSAKAAMKTSHLRQR